MKRVCALILFFALAVSVSGARADDYLQIPGVVHVHSTFSSGDHSLEQLVQKAADKNIGAIIVTDHDLVAMEYGLFPLRNIIKRREERGSILNAGAHKFLDTIARLNRQQNAVVVIPGAQSSPFYYWTGSPFKNNLKAHDYRKELLLIGMQTPEDYEGIPLLHRGLSTRYFFYLLPRAVLFLAALGLGLFLLFHKGLYRVVGVVVSGAGLLLLVNHHPFQSSRFDPYHGSQGIAPYQEVIDYAVRRKGLVFWAHPESNYSSEGVKLGPVTLETEHYADDLLLSRHYTGFAALYGDTSTTAKPGNHWDRILVEYCRGERKKPVWGIAEADYHADKQGIALDTFQTVFLVRNKSAQGLLEALAKGRVYAVLNEKGPPLVLERFEVQEEGGGPGATMGEELRAEGFPVVAGRISLAGMEPAALEVQLIRDGRVWQSIDGHTPLEFRFVDQRKITKRSYYRLAVKSPRRGRLLSNPIFVSGR